jgi:DNA-binding CsgD family transcriptional regulator
MSVDDPTRALAALLSGLNLALIGDPTAEQVMHRAAALAKSSGISSSEVESLTLLGLLHMVHGRDTDGCASIERAVSVYAFHDLERMLTTSGVLAIGRVALFALRGGAADIREAIAAVNAALPGLADLMPWYRPLAGGVLAFACAHTGDMDGFRQYVTWCDETETADSALCRLWASRARQEHAVASPLQQLSPAELRVWELLKGRMTLSEIAAQLFLSRETVKSHTVSIYRKLGVASRRDAQDLADYWS